MPNLTLPLIARVSPKPDGEFTPILLHTFTEDDREAVFGFFKKAMDNYYEEREHHHKAQ